jgi:DNA-binding MarR family transcriptional regulator
MRKGDSGSAHLGERAAAVRRLLIAATAASVRLARSFGVSVADMGALDYIEQQESLGRALGPSELAAHLGMTSASATALVDRLEAAGLVRRSPRTDDRRRVVLTVTPATRARVEELLGPALQQLDDITEQLGPADRRAVDAYLDRVGEVLQVWSADPGQPERPGAAETGAGTADGRHQ